VERGGLGFEANEVWVMSEFSGVGFWVGGAGGGKFWGGGGGGLRGTGRNGF